MMQQAAQQRALAPMQHPQLQRLRYIAQRIVPFSYEWNDRARQWKWEVNLLGDAQLNAFCMPGGKIAFYYGILEKLKLEDDEVAAIMGHEVSHALREHARERMGKTTAKNAVVELGSALLGLGNLGRYAAGVGAQLLSLKFSREDETEADLVGIELAARYEPASPSAEVGGDLYDAILLDSRRLALAIGDVSGKGLDAATIMASTQYMMRGFLFQGMQPGEVLSSLQSAMIKELDPAQFVTIFLSVLDLETYELSYANAGHPFPIVITSEGCDSMIGHNSGPVGVSMSLSAARGHRAEDVHWAIAEPQGYMTDRMTLPRDFGLIMYTDGMLDARSDGEFFGVGRILDICRQSHEASSDEIVERLLAAAREFTGGNLPDDIALLAARSPRLPAGPVTWDI